MGWQKLVALVFAVTLFGFPDHVHAQPTGKTVCDVVNAQVLDRVRANDRGSMNALRPIVEECIAYLKVELQAESQLAVEKAKALIDEYQKRKPAAPKP